MHVKASAQALFMGVGMGFSCHHLQTRQLGRDNVAWGYATQMVLAISFCIIVGFLDVSPLP
jgi:hypothetical protein